MNHFLIIYNEDNNFYDSLSSLLEEYLLYKPGRIELTQATYAMYFSSNNLTREKLANTISSNLPSSTYFTVIQVEKPIIARMSADNITQLKKFNTIIQKTMKK